MRILHLVGRSHRRGAELVATELAEELEALGHDNRLLAVGLGHTGESIESLPPLVGRIRQGPTTLLAAGWRLRGELRRHPIDLILAHGGSALQASVLAKPRGGPAILWQRILGAPIGPVGRGRQAWWRLVLRRTDGVVSLTEELATESVAMGFGGPAWIVPNARHPDRFTQLDRATSSAELRNALGLSPCAQVIGFVGHMVEQKRPERAVEVTRLLRDRGVDVHLVMVGGGPLQPRVRSAVDQHGLAAHVTMLGHRDDVEHILAALDVLVITSETEGIPGVAIEAQMAGCPVVTFPVGGVATVIDQGVSGIVLDDHSVPKMADAVAALLADPALQGAFSAQARISSQRFTMAAVASIYDRHMRSLVPRAQDLS